MVYTYPNKTKAQQKETRNNKKRHYWPECPLNKQRVDTSKVDGARNATLDEFSMHDVPRCLDNREDKTSRCRAKRGMESKQAEAHLAGYSRRVAPLAFIDRRVRPLDGWMVVANPYHQKSGFPLAFSGKIFPNILLGPL